MRWILCARRPGFEVGLDLFGSLGKLPGSPQLHRWADWAELLAFTSPEGRMTVPRLTELVHRREDSRQEELFDDAETQIDRRDKLGTHFESAPEFYDAVTSRAADVFEYLRARSDSFGDRYPFSFDAATGELSVRDLNRGRDLYMFLLAASSFRYVPSKRVQIAFAGAFELLCEIALAAHMPKSAEVYRFGTNLQNSPSRYTGDLPTKIRTLATDLRVSATFDEDDFEERDPGDGGLDLVAWVPLDPETSGSLTAFAQCAATPRWVEKQHSSGYSAWSKILKFQVPPVNFIFVPFDFRRPTRRWYAQRYIHQSVMIDRARILDAVGDASVLPSEVEQAFLDVRGALMQDLASV